MSSSSSQSEAVVLSRTPRFQVAATFVDMFINVRKVLIDADPKRIALGFSVQSAGSTRIGPNGEIPKPPFWIPSTTDLVWYKYGDYAEWVQQQFFGYEQTVVNNIVSVYTVTMY
jgi:hypothetical protein